MAKKQSLFVVSLEGLDLSKEQKKRIEQGIHDLVFKELASIDHDVDFKIGKKFAGRRNWEELWKTGQLAGFWVEGFPNFPGGGPIKRES